ncbi:MerR family DNA-binding protein [uncultured Salinisphaera sp.]|uniref:MerR family DNA-binding protein n=1 Tax=uncultured Salinisphaera sp. TaxID=359372 RepID=UPI0032B2D24A|tara:strand:- start:6129 stop:6545 length:417 start_codon:yes stop_codon:yes gene_type:complete
MAFSIGEAARHIDCPASTIRYYEQIGLVPPAQRAANGYRFYDDAAITRLGFVYRARSLGFSLDDVAALLRLADHPNAPCDDVDALVAEKITEVQARRADLAQLEDSLIELQACCHGAHDIADCGILSALAVKSGAVDT